MGLVLSFMVRFRGWEEKEEHGWWGRRGLASFRERLINCLCVVAAHLANNNVHKTNTPDDDDDKTSLFGAWGP